MRNILVLIFSALVLAFPLAATAQEEPPACVSPGAPLPTELAGWTTPAPLVSAAKPAELPKAALTVGAGATAALHQTADVAYVVLPEKPGGSVSQGGMFSLTIEQAGTYVVAIGSGAWIDVLKGKTSMASTAHGRGPACSTIHKMVDFPMQPGSYVIQVSANADPTLAIMVARRP